MNFKKLLVTIIIFSLPIAANAMDGNQTSVHDSDEPIIVDDSNFTWFLEQVCRGNISTVKRCLKSGDPVALLMKDLSHIKSKDEPTLGENYNALFHALMHYRNDMIKLILRTAGFIHAKTLLQKELFPSDDRRCTPYKFACDCAKEKGCHDPNKRAAFEDIKKLLKAVEKAITTGDVAEFNTLVKD